MKRIGLTQRVEVVATYGERRDSLDQRWARLLLRLGFCPVPLANEVQDVASYLAALSLDGIVFTGGNDLVGSVDGTDVTPERDRFEHLALDICTAESLPALGVCRGLQLLNVHCGGGLISVDSHVARSHSVVLDTQFFRGCPESILANSFHGFGIDDSCISTSLKPIAWAQDGTIEAAVHDTLPHFGIMWHPERERSTTEYDLLMIQTAFGDGQQ